MSSVLCDIAIYLYIHVCRYNFCMSVYIHVDVCVHIYVCVCIYIYESRGDAFMPKNVRITVRAGLRQ